MLIYFRKEGQLSVAQVMPTFGKTDVSIFDGKKIEDQPSAHQPFLERMKEDQIFVTGNTSTVGSGLFLDNLYSDITKINSSHPDIFTPLNPDYTPGRDKVEKKWDDVWRSFTGDLQKKRQEDVQASRPFKSLDEIGDLSDEKFKECRDKKNKELSELKSYRELGVIVEPTCIERYEASSIPSTLDNSSEEESPSVSFKQ